MPRTCTCKIIDLAEEHLISWESIARECLARMSEDEITDMVEECGWE